MKNVLGDIYAMVVGGKIDYDSAQDWIEDLLYLINARVLKSFELQYYSPNGNNIEGIKGYRYTVNDNGTIYENSKSGGIDPYEVSSEIRVKLYADIDFTKRNKEEVSQYLRRRGWGVGASLVGNSVYQKAYSKEGFGVERFRISS